MSATTHERLTELFSEALDLAPDARAALLARVRTSDPDLVDDLAALLEIDDRSALAATVDDGPFARRSTLRIPGYRVLDIVGEGGMGTVYEAEQLEPRRRVAIKVLYARSASALARFKAEAQIMARLDHPGIARVLEAGDADGQPYLVMEHVDGETLDRFTAPLPRDERLRLFVAMCDAVHHAHLNGVIHRDLKPSNVMVRADRRVVVLDFGVARISDDRGSTPSETRAGELVGTPLYMSPEQAQLRPDAVDARSDVYTLGVILYELVSGELPYPVRELPLPAVTAMICESTPTPLAKVDGDLAAIAMKALAKDPADRYQSVAALADDIRRHLRGEAVTVRNPSALERLRRFVRRRPLVAAAIAASLVGTAVLVLVITSLWLDARAARSSLEVRTNELTLKQARAALERDPTEAVAWLGTLTSRDVDAGAAWSILDEATARGVATHVLRGHADEVRWVEPVPGSDDFISSGYDGRVLLWRAPAYAPTTLLVAKRGRVHLARLSGDLLAIGCDDGEAYVTKRDGTIIAELTGHEGDVQHLAWSGSMLASGDDSGRLRLWTPTSSRELVASRVAIGAVAFAGDGSALIAADHDGTIWLWDTRTWKVRTASTGVDVAEVWTDGTRAAAIDAQGTLHRWRVEGDALVEEARVATGRSVKRAVFTADGATSAFGGVAGDVVQIRDGAPSVLANHRVQVRSLAIDAARLATGTDDGTLVLHDLATKRAMPLRGHTGRIRSLALTPTTLLSADSQGVIRRWDLSSLGARLLRADAPAIRLATNGTHLATADADGNVTTWNLADGSRVDHGPRPGGVTALAFVGDATVVGTADGSVTWHPGVTRHMRGVVTAIATSRDHVAVASKDGPIHIFSSAGDPIAELAGHVEGTEALAFDPTGTLLLSGGQDRSLRLWRRDATTFVLASTADGIDGDVRFVAFADGRAIAASDEGTVMAWRVDNHALVAPHTLANHRGAVTALHVAGNAVLSAGRDSRVIRAPLDGDAPTSATLTTAATTLAVDAAGAIHAVTRAGAVERIAGERGVAVIDHGIVTALPIAADRWVLAHDDGTLVIASLATHRIDDLAAAVTRTTTFTIK